MKLKNKVALITGSSKGIGKAIAILFAKEGARIIVNYCTSEKEALALVKEIEKLGSSAIAIRCDVSKEDEVKEMIEKAIKTFGKIDILVNNAGQIIRPGDSKADVNTWNKTININIRGVWLTIKNTVSYMQKGSSIVNIASYVGQLGSQYVLPYGVAKAGVINLTKAYAKELAPNIRVNSISPGNIDTSMTRDAGDEFIRKTVDNTPLKRLGNPEEVARAVVFLASEEASFITGVNLNVDGGYLLVN